MSPLTKISKPCICIFSTIAFNFSSLVNDDKINKVHEQWFLAFYSISVLSWKASISWSDPCWSDALLYFRWHGTGFCYISLKSGDTLLREFPQSPFSTNTFISLLTRPIANFWGKLLPVDRTCTIFCILVFCEILTLTYFAHFSWFFFFSFLD